MRALSSAELHHVCQPLAGGDKALLDNWVAGVLSGKRGSKAAVAAEVHSAATQSYGHVYRAPHHDLVVQGDVLACDQGYEQL